MQIQKLVLITSLLAFSSASLAEPKGPRMFDRADTNGDGYISLEEFSTPPKDRGHPADADGNGEITRAEISQHIAEQGAEKSERANEHFTKMDLNGDDVVTREEAKAAAFARMDKDQDGMLSKQELKRSHKKHSGKRKRDHDQ
tara:strand:- start:1969 stop:2397 length:429 start_codon:yes stop_codon:yes gene_type:complete